MIVLATWHVPRSIQPIIVFARKRQAEREMWVSVWKDADQERSVHLTNLPLMVDVLWEEQHFTLCIAKRHRLTVAHKLIITCDVVIATPIRLRPDDRADNHHTNQFSHFSLISISIWTFSLSLKWCLTNFVSDNSINNNKSRHIAKCNRWERDQFSH